MKKYTFLWCLIVLLAVAVVVLPEPRAVFINLTTEHPYLMGFLKFALLATMGELLAIRIRNGCWKLPGGILCRTLVWGVLGMMITLMFQVYAGGIEHCLIKGFLPGSENRFLFALWAAVIMNLSFAPAFMAFHRVTDTFIDKYCSGCRSIKVFHVLSEIDWVEFIHFIVLKTIPFFWIPAHTITFLLSPEYRVVMAAFLSIALGVFLSLGKRHNKTMEVHGNEL
ncbi:MAG: Mpv17/PMP22 family protein [Eubacteriales bacterium]|nr:Mpv17/PMP22 family protein [Eubacteriales bacterium]